MRRVNQRALNDCSIAAVATATGIPYPIVLRAARRQGFRPFRNTGSNFYQLLHHLGLQFDVRIYRMHGDPLVRPFCARGIKVVSIPSLNIRGDHRYHAVAVIDGKVIDPSTKKRATLRYVEAKARNAAVIWPVIDDRD